MENFQRIDARSNAQVGREFELTAQKILEQNGVRVKRKMPIALGVGELEKIHEFDLGSFEPPVIVECKSHRWTKGNNVPSAKITVWNEAMYLFQCSPSNFRKIFFVAKDINGKTGESLAEYYIRHYQHLIPVNVEFWEFDETTSDCYQTIPNPTPMG